MAGFRFQLPAHKIAEDSLYSATLLQRGEKKQILLLDALSELHEDAMRHMRFCHPRAKAHLDRYFDAMEQAAENSIKNGVCLCLRTAMILGNSRDGFPRFPEFPDDALKVAGV